jgi:hypothetical protein
MNPGREDGNVTAELNANQEMAGRCHPEMAESFKLHMRKGRFQQYWWRLRLVD